MKCKNCSCPVSSDFKHAFATNCCPKCGQTLMTNDVKHLYAQMEEVLQQNNNDIGDLAVWFVDTYFSAPTDNNVVATEGDVEKTASESPEVESVELEQPQKPLQVKKPIAVKRTQQASKEQSDRTSLFAKRAGVSKLISQDRNKFESLVKDIQNDNQVDYEENGDGEDYSMLEENKVPLSHRELNSVADLFGNENDGPVDFNEIQKLQKLEQLSMTGSLGKIRRST